MHCCGTTLDPAEAAADLVAELGAQEWANRVGVVPVAAITAAKLRWLADHEPAHADATAAVCLPHDWLTWRLSGSTDIADLRTDRSDASGTGYFSSESDGYQLDLLELAMRGRRPASRRCWVRRNRRERRRRVRFSGPAPGTTPGPPSAWAQARVTASSRSERRVSSVRWVTLRRMTRTGIVAGFADATGRHLPLVCTLNGAPVLAAVATMLGVDFDELDRLALSAPAGAEGLTLVPYFEGERSPNLPEAAGALQGVTTRNLNAANVARAAVEGLLSSMAYCIDRITAHGVDVQRIILVGGGARSEAVRHYRACALGRSGACADARGVRRAGRRPTGCMGTLTE